MGVLNILENNRVNLMQFSKWQLFERNHEQTKLSSEISREALLSYYGTRCETSRLNLSEPVGIHIFNQRFVSVGRLSLPVANLS